VKDSKKTKEAYRGIAFDMDGVLVDSMKYHAKAWKKTFFHFYQFNISDLEIFQLEGVKGQEIIKIITSKRMKFPKEEEILNIHNYKRKYFNSIFKIEPIPGIINLIKLVSKFGYKLALVTGTSEQITSNIISSLDLGKYFEVVITGDDNIRGKPFPEPYDLAAKKLGIKNSLCLVIENAPEGIKSAKAANMPCIAIQTTLEKSYLTQSDKIFQDIYKVQRFIEIEYKISGGLGSWVL
jgi:HAD superfamily hydrolase (TIGR01509 family)